MYWGLVHPVTLADSCYHYQHFQIPKRTSIDQNEDNDKENSENQSVNGSTTNGKPGRKVSDKINRNHSFLLRTPFSYIVSVAFSEICASTFCRETVVSCGLLFSCSKRIHTRVSYPVK